MELLRLVLAHQPITRLQLLPKLARDKRFQTTQLSQSTKAEFGVIRAAFLRDPDLFRYYISKPGVEPDIWYALSVGEPEITKECARFIKQGRFFIVNFNSFDAIEWTPELIEAIRSPLVTENIFAMAIHSNGEAQFLQGFFFGIDLRDPPVQNLWGRLRRLVPRGKEYEYNREANEFYQKEIFLAYQDPLH